MNTLSDTCILATFLLAVAVSASPVNALEKTDTERIADLERKLEQSLRVIQRLSTQISDLDKSSHPQPRSANQAVSAKPTEIQASDIDEPSSQNATASRLDTAEQQIARMQLKHRESTSFDWFHGFADVGAAYSDEEGNKGFTLGSANLYFIPQLSDHVKALTEIVFEYDDAGELAVDLERLQIGYSLRGGHTIWIGRFHTPLGSWNTGFHHGMQLQTSILRPRFIDFEDRGGILPVHTVGLLGTGSIRRPEGRISYDLYTGNSPSMKDNTLSANNTGNHPAEISVGFNLSYLFDNIGNGLKVGLHGLRADVRDDTSDKLLSEFGMLGAYALVDTAEWELIAEYYGFHNQNAQSDDHRHSSWAGFTQLGRRLGPWTVFGRVERASLNTNDNYFQALESGSSYHRQALGMRYDITLNSALKLELIHSEPVGTVDKNFNEALMQWAYRF